MWCCFWRYSKRLGWRMVTRIYKILWGQFPLSRLQLLHYMMGFSCGERVQVVAESDNAMLISLLETILRQY